MPRFIPKGAKFWEQKVDALPIGEVIGMYDRGFAGAWHDPEAKEERRALAAATGFVAVEDAASAMGWQGASAGQLVVPFVYVVEAYPGCYPGPAQQRGDCVSHSCSGACLLTIVGDVVGGAPDPESGKLEECPAVTDEGVRNNVTSSEWPYWWRGYNGDGWSCDSAALVAQKHGIMLRASYPELGIDLSRYSGSLAGKYGAHSPPDNMDAVGKVHHIQTTADVNSPEGLRDALGNLHGISTCGGEGWSSQRDEYGFSRRQGGWSHGFKFIGFDDRDVIKSIFREPLVLCCNNWGAWNSGPRDIYQSAALVPAAKKDEWIAKGIVNSTTGNILIPEGAWWAKWSDVQRRQIIAYGGVSGWERKKVPHVLI